MLKVGIINVTGYAGMELARLLRFHQEVELVGVTGRSSAGRQLDQTFPHLDQMDLPIVERDALDGIDVAFSALPHKASAEACIGALEKGAKVIDISADFRLHDVSEYEAWYQPHPAPQYLEEAVYGLTELHRAQVVGSRLVANPGCYPTGALLGLAPLAKEHLIGPDVIVDSKSGVSGAGRSLSLNVHFSEANENVSAYGLSGHRHLPEITQELREVDGSVPWAVTFTPHLIPMTRGILSTIYTTPIDTSRIPISADGQKQLRDLFEDFYRDEPFVRVTADPPQTKQVAGSNMTQVYPVINLRTGRIIVVTAIDNLVKGAAGQAIQNMNLMCGMPKTEGLKGIALYP